MGNAASIIQDHHTIQVPANGRRCGSDLETEQDKLLLQLRDLVLRDSGALKVWPMVVDHIVMSEADSAQLKAALLEQADGQTAAAVLESLRLWRNSTPMRPDLPRILCKFNLHHLADAIQVKTGIVSPVAKSGIAFGVVPPAPHFVGREADLELLHLKVMDSYSQRSSIANIVCIIGLGGIGKTELARRYARDFRGSFDWNVVWINAVSLAAMRFSFLQVGRVLGERVGDRMADSELARQVMNHFKDRHSLFVFDGADNPDELYQFVPPIDNPDYSAPHLLVTSRRADLAPVLGNRLLLQGLEMADAAQLIRSKLRNPVEASVRILAERLSGYPPALKLVTEYLQEKSGSGNLDVCAEYLRELETPGSDCCEKLVVELRKPLAVLPNAQDGRNAEAVHIFNVVLCLCACPGNKVDPQLVSAIFGNGGLRNLKLLERYLLITVQQNCLLINPILQNVSRFIMNPAESAHAMETVILFLKDWLKQQLQWTRGQPAAKWEQNLTEASRITRQILRIAMETLGACDPTTTQLSSLVDYFLLTELVTSSEIVTSSFSPYKFIYEVGRTTLATAGRLLSLAPLILADPIGAARARADDSLGAAAVKIAVSGLAHGLRWVSPPSATIEGQIQNILLEGTDSAKAETEYAEWLRSHFLDVSLRIRNPAEFCRILCSKSLMNETEQQIDWTNESQALRLYTTLVKLGPSRIKDVIRWMEETNNAEAGVRLSEFMKSSKIK